MSASRSRTTACFLVLLLMSAGFALPATANHQARGVPDPQDAGEVLFLRPDGLAYNTNVPNPPGTPYAEVHGLGAAVLIQVTDADLTDTVQNVQVSATHDGSGETIPLARVGDGIYHGYVGFEAHRTADNGLVFVEDGDTVTVIYVDDQDASDEASVSQDFITWREGFAGRVSLNQGAYFGSEAVVDVLVEDGDLEGASFDVRVTSETDADGIVLALERVSDGVYEGSFAFVTGGDPSDAATDPPVLAIESGEAFTVTYDETGFDARGREESPKVTGTWSSSHTALVQWTTQDRREVVGDPVLYGQGAASSPDGSDANGWIRVEDRDLAGAGTVMVNVRSFGTPSVEVDPSGINIQLSETGNATGEFVGHVGFILGSPSSGARLRVADGAEVVAVYTDARDADGETTETTAAATWRHRELAFTISTDPSAAKAASFNGGWVADGCTGGNGDFGCRPGRGHLRFTAPGETAASVTARLVSTRDPAGVDVTLSQTSSNGIYAGTFAFHHPGSHPEGSGPAHHNGLAGIWALKGDKLEAYVVGERSTTGGLHQFQAQSVDVKDQSGATAVTAPTASSDLKLVFAQGEDATEARDRDFFGNEQPDVYLKDGHANQDNSARDVADIHVSSINDPSTWTFADHDTVLTGYDPNTAISRDLTEVQYIDANGNSAHDPGERIFISKPSAGIEAGDIVVYPQVDFGRVVTDGHANVTASAPSLPLSFAYVDLNGSGTPDKDDMYFLAAGATVAAGHIVLNGTDAGKKTDGSESYDSTPVAAHSAGVFAVDLNENGTSEADEDAFWDIDGDNERSAGDLYVSGAAAGSVETEDDRFLALHDTDGNGAISSGDTYLLVAGAEVAAGDIIVGGTNHGKRIATGDARIGTDANELTLSFLHDDANGSATIDADEDLYLDTDLSGHRSHGDLYFQGPKAFDIETAKDLLQSDLTGGHAVLTADETAASSKEFRDVASISATSVHGDTYCLHYLHSTAAGVPVKVQQSPCVRWHVEQKAPTDTVRSDAITADVQFRNASHQGRTFADLELIHGLRTAYVFVKDPDVVTETTDQADHITVTVRSSSDNTGINVKLTERYGHIGLAPEDVAWGGEPGTRDDRSFIGAFKFTKGSSGNGALQVKHDDVVTASFDDPSKDTGGALTPVARVKWQETTHASIVLDRDHYRHAGDDAVASNQPVQVTVTDLDRNQNTAFQDTLTVRATSKDAGDEVTFTLTETTATSGVFKGQFRTDRQFVIDRDGMPPTSGNLAVLDEDTITVMYADLDRAGQRVERTAEATWYDMTATRMLLNKTTYASYGDEAAIELHDPDLDVKTTADEVKVFVTSESDGRGELVTLRETGPRTGVFVGGFGFESSPQPDNQMLAVKHGDRFVVHFIDIETTGDGQGDEHRAKEAVGFWDLTANVGPTITVTTSPAMDDSDTVSIEPGDTVDFMIGLDDVDGTVASWIVDYGDGSDPTRSASTSGAIPAVLQHTYADGGSYTVTINATDEDGTTTTRALTVLADAGDIDAPGNISGLQVTQVSRSKAVLSWTAPENNAEGADGKAVDNYVVKLSDEAMDDEAAFVAAAPASAADLAFDPAPLAGPGQTQRVTVRGLEPETTYFIAVQARDAGNNRGGFRVIEVTTTAQDLTAPVGVLSVTSSHEEGVGQAERDITFDWSTATDDESPVVYRWELNGRSAFTVTMTTGTAEATTNTGYTNQPEGSYYFHVAACSETQCGPTTTYGPVVVEVEDTPDPTPGITPEDLDAALKGIHVSVVRDGNDNVVSWTLPSDPPAKGVLIWANDGGNWTRVADLSADDEAFTKGAFVHKNASRDTQYVVTSYYGTTAAEGYADASDDLAGFDGLEKHGVAQAEATAWPTWFIATLAAVGLLLLVLVVAVIVVARGRGGEEDEEAPEGMAWNAEASEPAWGEAPAEEPAWGEGPQDEGADPWAEEATADPWGEELQEPGAPPYAEEVPEAPEETFAGAGAVVPGEAYEEGPEEQPFDPDLHHLNCPSCGADFTANGPKPLVTECPSCGVRGILR